MAWIKSSNPRVVAMFFFVLSFSGFLLGQNTIGLTSLMIALFQSLSRVKVLKPYEPKEEVAYAGFWPRVGSGLANTILRVTIFILIYSIFAQISVNGIGQCLSLLFYLLIELFTLKTSGQTPGD